jgi:hypothetical protein
VGCRFLLLMGLRRLLLRLLSCRGRRGKIFMGYDIVYMLATHQTHLIPKHII